MKTAEARRLAALCWANGDPSGIPDPHVTTACRLWAGMGHIYRLSDDDHHQEPIIVKLVRLPSTSSKAATTMSLGDRRKADSYHVEASFYRHVANPLLSIGVGVPRPLHIETDDKNDHQILICMSELRGRSLHGDSLDDVRSVLTWMAKFHSLYWGHDEVDAVVNTAGLQAVGTYWHLDTRPDEHSNMSRSGLSGRLKLSARAIDLQLKNSPFQCLVHGDPKDANILLMDNPNHDKVNGVSVATTASLYDFQYCGKGSPAKDLAYFLCSSVDDDDKLSTDGLVKYYHEQLVRHLTASHRHASLIPTLEQLNELLDLALCDYYRFLCGWGRWGSLRQAERRVRSVLDRLDGGSALRSPEQYQEAMEREYGS